MSEKCHFFQDALTNKSHFANFDVVMGLLTKNCDDFFAVTKRESIPLNYTQFILHGLIGVTHRLKILSLKRFKMFILILSIIFTAFR